MSEQTQATVTFTAEEQVALRQLEANGRVLANVAQLLKNGLFPGGTAQSVLESILFVESVLKNNSSQATDIYSAAQKRTEEEATPAKAAKAN